MSRTPFSKLATCLLVALFSHLHRPALGILDPLSDKEYSIVITDAPLQLQTSGGQVVDIADARGRTLHCLIPQGEGEAGSKRSRIQNTSAWALLDPLGALPAAWALPATKGLDQVCQVDLAGQADRGKRCAEDQCFGKRDGMGWWTVSVCYKKQAEQYHEGENGEIVSRYLLGTYDAAVANPREVGEGAAAYLSHTYTQGETCDLTGKPRLAEVRYFCGEGSNADVTNIMEEPSCEYVIHVHTRLLCSHPNFKPQTGKMLIPITCSTHSAAEEPVSSCPASLGTQASTEHQAGRDAAKNQQAL